MGGTRLSSLNRFLAMGILQGWPEDVAVDSLGCVERSSRSWLTRAEMIARQCIVESAPVGAGRSTRTGLRRLTQTLLFSPFLKPPQWQI